MRRRTGARRGATVPQVAIVAAMAAVVVGLGLSVTLAIPLKETLRTHKIALTGWQVLVLRLADFAMGYWWLIVVVLGVAAWAGSGLRSSGATEPPGHED